MMKLPRGSFLHLAAGAAALPAVSRFARAQVHPTRPVHTIVPYAPGGTTDIVARLIGQRLSERLGQQFIIENRPGAGGNIGTDMVARAPPDGYTFLLVTTTNAVNATLSRPFFPGRRFALFPRRRFVAPFFGPGALYAASYSSYSGPGCQRFMAGSMSGRAVHRMATTTITTDFYKIPTTRR
jgi:hypothetical protein